MIIEDNQMLQAPRNFLSIVTETVAFLQIFIGEAAEIYGCILHEVRSTTGEAIKTESLFSQALYFSPAASLPQFLYPKPFYVTLKF